MLKIFGLKNGTRLQRKDTFFQYSTDEQFTGKYWVDGKKIYIKSFQASMSAINSGNANVNVSNLGAFRTFYLPGCMYYRNDNEIYTGNCNGFELGTINSHGNFNGVINSNWANDTKPNVWITVTYTKTTN